MDGTEGRQPARRRLGRRDRRVVHLQVDTPDADGVDGRRHDVDRLPEGNLRVRRRRLDDDLRRARDRALRGGSGSARARRRTPPPRPQSSATDTVNHVFTDRAMQASQRSMR